MYLVVVFVPMCEDAPLLSWLLWQCSSVVVLLPWSKCETSRTVEVDTDTWSWVAWKAFSERELSFQKENCSLLLLLGKLTLNANQLSRGSNRVSNANKPINQSCFSRIRTSIIDTPCSSFVNSLYAYSSSTSTPFRTSTPFAPPLQLLHFLPETKNLPEKQPDNGTFLLQ